MQRVPEGYLSLLYCSFVVAVLAQSLSGQMINRDGHRAFGNEWIDYDALYYRWKVVDDGLYRIYLRDIPGWRVSDSVRGADIALIWQGRAVPIYVSSQDVLSADDFIEFYGQKNRGQLDVYLFKEGVRTPLNPRYSLFSDTSVYFLTWNAEVQSYARRMRDASTSTVGGKVPSYGTVEWDTVFHDRWNKNTSDVAVVSLFDMAEGYGYAQPSREVKIQFRLAGVQHTGQKAQVRIRYTNYVHGQWKHSEATFTLNGHYLGKHILDSARVAEVVFEVEDTLLRSVNEIVLRETAGGDGLLMPAFVAVTYHRDFAFWEGGIQELSLPPSDTALQLHIEGMEGGDVLIVWEKKSAMRYRVVRSGDRSFRFVLPPSRDGYDLVMAVEGDIHSPFYGGARRFRRPDDVGDYLIITNALFRQGPVGEDVVEAYARYRSSAEGGGYRVSVWTIDEIEDAYAWGIFRHSLAVRHFIQDIFHRGQRPKFLLLIGKGRTYNNFPRGTQKYEEEYHFLPTYGYPGSDVLMVSDLDNRPLLAVGRLPVIRADEISVYLAKLRALESLQHSAVLTPEELLWTKRIIHLSGGKRNEQPSFRRHMKELEDIIEQPLWGADVTTFYKENRTHEQPASARMNALINSGVSLITYLGHSNFTLLDFNIDPPETYQNKDRYYVFMSLGCLAGDFFRTTRSISEHHVLIPDRGAIAYVANSSSEFPRELALYSKRFYRYMNDEGYGVEVGKGIWQVGLGLLTYYDTTRSGLYRHPLRRHQQVWTVTFCGDPAVHFRQPRWPDFTFEVGAVQIEPTSLYRGVDSFRLRFSIVNLGKAIDSVVEVEFTHQFPDGQTRFLKRVTVPTPYYADTFEVMLPLDESPKVSGLNRILIHINPDRRIAEGPIPQAYDNNWLVINGQRGYPIFVGDDGLIPLYPRNFGIVGTTPVVLQVSSAQFHTRQREILFEIDTVPDFRSSFKRSHVVHSGDRIITWTLPFASADSQVYYWRVRDARGGQWRTSSFVYLEGIDDGWNQSHWGQFVHNVQKRMGVDSAVRYYDFARYAIEIKAQNMYFPRSDRLAPTWFYGNAPMDKWGSKFPSVSVAFVVIDPLTGEVWKNPPGGKYGAFNPYTTPLPSNYLTIFPFYVNTPAQRDSVERFLRDIVPNGHYVIFYGIKKGKGDYKPHLWRSDPGENIAALLERYGARRIDELIQLGARPYLFCFKKADTSFMPIELIAQSDTEIIEARFVVHPKYDSGTVESVLIGPAQRWKHFEWHVAGADTDDAYSCAIYGVSSDGQRRRLVGELNRGGQRSLADVLTDPWPMLQLVFSVEDAKKRTAPELHWWRVYYDALPDLSLEKGQQYTFVADTLEQGQKLQLQLEVHNPSPVDVIDSVELRFQFIQSGSNTVIERSLIVPPLASGARRVVAFQYVTADMQGAYVLHVELNPSRNPAEQYYFNNFAEFEFFVRGDDRGPLLDVRFDGVHIRDGDLVSSRPKIEIFVLDDNPHFPLNDTAVVDVYLGRTPFELYRQSYRDSGLVFIPPADPMERNEAQVVLQRRFSEGIHYLRVRARDARGNVAGVRDYFVSFRVVDQDGISAVVSYPNPFSTRTRFYYTLSGKTLPSDYYLRIYTADGRLVRHVSRDELGPLRFGTHAFEWEWGGTDADGTPLANGIYIYQFAAWLGNGERFPRLDAKRYRPLESVERLWRVNHGKMLLLR